MELRILTPRDIKYSGKVKSIRLKSDYGDFVILNNHMPLVSTVVEDVVSIVEETGERKEIKVSAGIVKVENNHVTLLCV